MMKSKIINPCLDKCITFPVCKSQVFSTVSNKCTFLKENRLYPTSPYIKRQQLYDDEISTTIEFQRVSLFTKCFLYKTYCNHICSSYSNPSIIIKRSFIKTFNLHRFYPNFKLPQKNSYHPPK